MVLNMALHMPPPINYSFEKRKRENAKKAAKEAKRLRKEAAKNAAPDSTDPETPSAAEESGDSATTL